MKRSRTFSDLTQKQIESYFGDLNRLDSSYKHLVESIVFISDHFQSESSTTPWGQEHRQEAYFLYFHTLNTLRMEWVFLELQHLCPDFHTETIIDFGSGLGATEVAFQNIFSISPKWTFIENSSEAQSFHRKIRKFISQETAEWNFDLHAINLKNSTLVASYSLNEMSQYPASFLEAETLVLLEPSTTQSARALMNFRKKLIENGFSVLAPCTHQDPCPLLTHSKKDWCYDRVFFDAPEWFKKLESHLPMKNRTLTFSYLIASKKYRSNLTKNFARVIGDTLKEKGKTRQMVCRGQEREFLSWLDRLGPAPEIPHGALIQIPEDYLKKGESEIRTTPKVHG